MIAIHSFRPELLRQSLAEVRVLANETIVNGQCYFEISEQLTIVSRHWGIIELGKGHEPTI